MKKRGLLFAGIWLVILGLTLSVVGYAQTDPPVRPREHAIVAQLSSDKNSIDRENGAYGVFLLPAGASISVGGLLLILGAWGRDEEQE
ncbi:MAG: hypothetical protein ACOZBW_08135 [Thermodesulfobacteriota bacterium]